MADSLPIIVKEYIRANSLIGEGDRVIVGLSGGADSVALLSVLRDLRVPVVAVHCNFHLRGEESNRDEEFCRRLCASLDVPLDVVQFDVEERRAITGESLEMACRELRYDRWRGMISEGRGTLVAVGHHREDNIETFFINLLRGCGLAGLKGMLPRNGLIVRPLLDVTRRQIEDYLDGKGLTFVTDSSNLEDDFRRNKLRLNILPVIEREFPGASNAISRTIGNLRGNFALYKECIGSLRSRFTDGTGRINVSRIINESPDPSTTLYELASEFGVNSHRAAEIVSSVRSGSCSGKWFGNCLLDRGILITSPEVHNAPSRPAIANITPEEFFSLLSRKQLDRNSLYLDADKFDPDALEVRTWRPGDRIAPFGMKGTRLVSDILSDAKIPLNEKASVRVVEYNGKLLWVAGLRASRHFPVTAETSSVAVITLK